MAAEGLDFEPTEGDWQMIVDDATPRASYRRHYVSSFHCLLMAHVIRRPIVVSGPESNLVYRQAKDRAVLDTGVV
jgi:hypothetical protein